MCIGKVFVRTIGIVMSPAKISCEKLILMINPIANDMKLKAIMGIVGVGANTGYLWRMKVYSACAEIQKDAMLSGQVWIDEKFIPVDCRLEFRFPDGSKPRRVSRNQVCAACAANMHGNRYAEVSGEGHII